jgi:hypothetical protein
VTGSAPLARFETVESVTSSPLVVERDDGMFQIGWHGDAPVPFESFPFALAVAAQRVSA